jgi:hypothetical protein
LSINPTESPTNTILKSAGKSFKGFPVGRDNERVRALFEEWVKLASMVYPINTAELTEKNGDETL